MVRNDEKNRDPKRAYARALTDLRCAARKLAQEAREADLDFHACAIEDALGEIEHHVSEVRKEPDPEPN